MAPLNLRRHHPFQTTINLLTLVNIHSTWQYIHNFKRDIPNFTHTWNIEMIPKKPKTKNIEMSVWWTPVKCPVRCRVNFFIEKSGSCSRTHRITYITHPQCMVSQSWMFKIRKGRKFMICLCASDPKNRTKLYYKYIIAVIGRKFENSQFHII